MMMEVDKVKEEPHDYSPKPCVLQLKTEDGETIFVKQENDDDDDYEESADIFEEPDKVEAGGSEKQSPPTIHAVTSPVNSTEKKSPPKLNVKIKTENTSNEPEMIYVRPDLTTFKVRDEPFQPIKIRQPKPETKSLLRQTLVDGNDHEMPVLAGLLFSKPGNEEQKKALIPSSIIKGGNTEKRPTVTSGDGPLAKKARVADRKQTTVPKLNMLLPDQKNQKSTNLDSDRGKVSPEDNSGKSGNIKIVFDPSGKLKEWRIEGKRGETSIPASNLSKILMFANMMKSDGKDGEKSSEHVSKQNSKLAPQQNSPNLEKLRKELQSKQKKKRVESECVSIDEEECEDDDDGGGVGGEVDGKFEGFKCKICSKEFLNKAALTGHLKIHHLSLSGISGSTPKYLQPRAVKPDPVPKKLTQTNTSSEQSYITVLSEDSVLTENEPTSHKVQIEPALDCPYMKHAQKLVEQEHEEGQFDTSLEMAYEEAETATSNDGREAMASSGDDENGEVSAVVGSGAPSIETSHSKMTKILITRNKPKHGGDAGSPRPVAMIPTKAFSQLGAILPSELSGERKLNQKKPKRKIGPELAEKLVLLQTSKTPKMYISTKNIKQEVADYSSDSDGDSKSSQANSGTREPTSSSQYVNQIKKELPSSTKGKALAEDLNLVLRTHVDIPLHKLPTKSKAAFTPGHESGKVPDPLPLPLPRKQYVCELCLMEYNCSKTFEQHMIIHARERPLLCGVCDSSFYLFSDLERHVTTHADPTPRTMVQFTCSQCDEEYENEDDLHEHIQSHGNVETEMVYECGQCGEELNSHAELQVHMKKHSGDAFEPCKCGICRESFSEMDELRKHFRNQHYRVSDFICKYCRCRFKTRDELSTHMAIHVRLTEVPMKIVNKYKCRFCVFRFATKEEMEAHQDSEHQNMPLFECSFCHLMFESKAKLLSHVKTHSVVAHFL